jgi:hypothetical protein
MASRENHGFCDTFSYQMKKAEGSGVPESEIPPFYLDLFLKCIIV